MLTVHHALAFLLVGVCIVAALLALLSYWRGGPGGGLVAHALALAQTLIVGQAAVGLLLLADNRRAGQGEHYMYGSLAVLTVAWPWFYAPPERRKRLAWFAAATLLAAVLAVRAFMTA